MLHLYIDEIICYWYKQLYMRIFFILCNMVVEESFIKPLSTTDSSFLVKEDVDEKHSNLEFSSSKYMEVSFC